MQEQRFYITHTRSSHRSNGYTRRTCFYLIFLVKSIFGSGNVPEKTDKDIFGMKDDRC